MSSARQFGQRGFQDYRKQARRFPVQRPPVDLADRGYPPIATLCLVAVLVIGYFLQSHFYFDRGLSWIGFRNASALGGLNLYYLSHEGEWWRIFTSYLLSERLTHLIGDAGCLLLCGYFVERYTKSQWLLATFFLGGITGSLASLAFYNELYTDADGQAGAAVGFLLVLLIHVPAAEVRRKFAAVLLSAVLIHFVFAVVNTNFWTLLNSGPFFSGIVTGALLGVLALRGDRHHGIGFTNAVLLAPVITIAISCLSFFLVSSRFERYQEMSSGLVPSASFPHDATRIGASDDSDGVRILRGLEASYPKDPLPHFYLGLQEFVVGNHAEAESEFRFVTANDELLETQYPGDVRRSSLRYLALLQKTKSGEQRADR